LLVSVQLLGCSSLQRPPFLFNHRQSLLDERGDLLEYKGKELELIVCQ
jgi:hypothetical protein